MLTTTARRSLASFTRLSVTSHVRRSPARCSDRLIPSYPFTQTLDLGPRRHLFTRSATRMADSENSAAQPVKTAKQLKKEAEKQAKLEKFKAKQAKMEAGQKQSKVCMYILNRVWIVLCRPCLKSAEVAHTSYNHHSTRPTFDPG